MDDEVVNDEFVECNDVDRNLQAYFSNFLINFFCTLCYYNKIIHFLICDMIFNLKTTILNFCLVHKLIAM